MGEKVGAVIFPSLVGFLCKRLVTICDQSPGGSVPGVRRLRAVATAGVLAAVTFGIWSGVRPAAAWAGSAPTIGPVQISALGRPRITLPLRHRPTHNRPGRHRPAHNRPARHLPARHRRRAGWSCDVRSLTCTGTLPSGASSRIAIAGRLPADSRPGDFYTVRARASVVGPPSVPVPPAPPRPSPSPCTRPRPARRSPPLRRAGPRCPSRPSSLPPSSSAAESCWSSPAAPALPPATACPGAGAGLAGSREARSHRHLRYRALGPKPTLHNNLTERTTTPPGHHSEHWHHSGARRARRPAGGASYRG